ncbi:MAG: transporter substrate-binding domain-containing protein [Pseudomonadota bacterium]
MPFACLVCVGLALWHEPRTAAETVDGSTAEVDAAPDTTPKTADDDSEALLDYAVDRFEGDLDAIVERGVLRVGTVHNPLFFTFEGAEQRGLVVDEMRELQKHLRKTLGKEAAALTIIVVPQTRDRLLQTLQDGVVELAVANLTITPERLQRVDFTDPLLTGVHEVVVTGEALKDIASLDDLAEVGLHLRPSSSYAEHLKAINAKRQSVGKAEIPTTAMDERLQDNDLLEMVSAGVIPAIAVDLHKATLWSQIYEGLVVHEDVTLSDDGEIAWAVRKGTPKLRQALNGFVKRAKKGTELGNILYNRYYGSPERIENLLEPEPRKKLRAVMGMIRDHAPTYGFEPFMIAAQGFQESGLDQSKRSKAGAIGIMQLLPSTAKDPNVDIPDITDADRNVEAGVKYLRFLRSRYFDDPAISPEDQVFLSLAAYNAGPGNIRKARARAEKMGLDPTVWFDNVEVATARLVGREPVVYVRNILKYFTTYTLYRELSEQDGG